MQQPKHKFNRDYQGWRADMRSFLDQGADGYVVWDARRIISRIGDIGYECKGVTEPVRSQPRHPKKLKLKTLQGIRMDRHHHSEVI